jgi:aspartyl-tRNA(Asn)/glutamyl-tRNA(Gln) amidotransferase subunit A
VQDTAILLNALASPAIDNYGADIDFRKSFHKTNKPVIGVMKNYKASAEVETVFREAIKAFISLGCKITDVILPDIPEASIFGDSEIEAYHKPLIAKYKEDYNPVTLVDMEGLKKVSTTDYINQRNQMDEDRITISAKLFTNIDVMILPTTTTTTPTLEEANANGPFTLDPFNTESFDYYGLPAISIPCGFDKNGLPLGMQVVGPRWGEAEVLDAANKYQQATGWHLKHPFK